MTVCPVCKTELKAGLPGGLCANCLLSAAVDTNSPSHEADSETATLHLDALDSDTFGPYRILGLLGEGGMGSVYLAEQTTPIHRRVALKVVKLGMDTSQVLARFNHERQSLALMEHSHIARILDAGASSRGRPFFVMDYIDGLSITTYSDRHQLTIEDRLRLCLPICRAVQHAHNKGLIHRDIKPSNVLITVEDGKPVPKVIDFGIARAIETGDSGGTFATQLGQMVGTPEYASPEQADVIAGEIGPATDVYSLGVLLYELLSGSVPFEGERLRKAGYTEMLRILREEEPPSLVEKWNQLGPARERVAARRGTTAATLEKLLAGDLNSIIAKALQKSPRDRYPSPSALCADIERFLAGERILAAPPARPRVVRRAFFAAALLLVLVIGVWIVSRARHPASQPAVPSTIVVGDVTNDSGDPSFDTTFRQTIGFELQRAPNINVLQDARMDEILRQMRKAPGTRLTPDVTREICERTAGAAFIESAVSKAGSGYLLTVRARDCTSGDLIDGEQAQVASNGEVLGELRRLTSSLQAKSAESFIALQKKAPPLMAATTTSLEALQSFTLGEHRSYSSPADSLVLLERATRIDPEFALAHAWLGRSYADNGQQTRAMESIRKAYSLIGIVGDREHYFITYNYDKEVLRNLELCRQICDAWIQKYPREMLPHGFLSGLTSKGTAQFEKSIEEGENAIALDPDFTIGYSNIAESYLALNRLDQVKAILDRAAARKLSNKNSLTTLLLVSFLQRDQQQVSRFAAELSRAMPFGESELCRSLISADQGRIQQSRQLSDQAVNLANQAHYAERAALAEGAAAIREAVFGYPQEAARHAKAARQLAKGRDVDFPPAFALALSQSPAPVLPVVQELDHDYPEDTCVRFNYSPTLRALIALRQGSPAKAIEILTISKTYEFALTGVSLYAWYGAVYPVYVRGLAMQQLGKPREAAAEFRRILEHPGVLLADPIASATRVQLARALRDAGDVDHARTAYRDFLDRWKDADDPAIPLLQQAKAEYARL